MVTERAHRTLVALSAAQARHLPQRGNAVNLRIVKELCFIKKNLRLANEAKSVRPLRVRPHPSPVSETPVPPSPKGKALATF